MTAAERILIWTGHVCLTLYIVGLAAGAILGSVGLVLTGVAFAMVGMGAYCVGLCLVYGDHR